MGHRLRCGERLLNAAFGSGFRRPSGGREFLLGVALLLACVGHHPALAQALLPQISSAGIVNAASFAQPISPGSIVSLFGSNLAPALLSATSVPLPTELAGTSVTVNGIKAPLFFVSAGQINLQLPWETPFSYVDSTPVPTVYVMVTTPAGTSAAVAAPVSLASPSLFSADGTGCGPAAALNIAPDGSVSVNSPSNSAAPGDTISLHGTGFGMVYLPPSDGAVSSGSERFFSDAGPKLDGGFVSIFKTVLAPGLIGVNQANFQIPLDAREGCAIPVSIVGNWMESPVLSLSIHAGRGQCVDPAISSYGRVTLIKEVSSGGNNPPVSETLTATFPAGPGVQAPGPLSVSPLGYYLQNYPTWNLSRACPLRGRSQLSASTLRVQSAGLARAFTAEPQPSLEGVSYQQSLPAGALIAGQYTVSAEGGSVGFQGALTLPPPIDVQNALAPGTKISMSQPLVVRWNGGTAGTLVKVMLIAHAGNDHYVDYAYVDGATGSFTFNSICTGHSVGSGGNGVYCSFDIPDTGNVSVVLEVSPPSGIANSVGAQGLTQGVQLSWLYRYVFDGLRFGP